ncbi:MAG TPA: ROK family transcriptional regulator [Solirubrobacteraceae bacterium]
MGTNASSPDPRRAANRERVIAALRQHGALSRAELAVQARLSRATVSSIVSELDEAGLVVESESAGDRSPQPGRPPALVRLDPSAGAAVGIDFGKRHVRVVVADLGHRVLAERCSEIDPDHTARNGMQRAAALLDEVLEEAGVNRSRLVGVGMGLPGPVVLGTGEMGSSTILPGWVGVRPQEAMTERLGVTVQVDNDANLGALGEWTWGAGRGASNMVYLKASTGIGAGLILMGRLFRGAGGTAGEIGHTIVDPSGPVCRCGNRGCLETLVGAPALEALLAPTLGEVTVHEVIARAAGGDQACRRVIGDAGTAIGTATANLCNLFNPGRIVVGGDLAAAGELLLAPLRAALERAAIPSAAQDAEVVPAVLGDRAEVLGAVALVVRERGLSIFDGAASREAAA